MTPVEIADAEERAAGHSVKRIESAAKLIRSGWKEHPEEKRSKVRYRAGRKNLESVKGLLELPVAEQRRQILPGDAPMQPPSCTH